ncbi:MAG: dihydropteroate synthase [Zetaproteobacteria bacterium CG1_02_53_45]|nr:MAG: dihydropteroate synthase [Zetaproteobacteria bacterium CG1_02_53_45]
MRSRWFRPRSADNRGDVWIMGVLNCTPDSFSDGGSFINVEAAVSHGLAMWKQGARLIDVGGESTRPGAAQVPLAEELERVIPVVRQLTGLGCAVSIDTMKAEVMRQAIAAGAVMVNDVSALDHEPESLAVVAQSGVDVCLMHMQGNPQTMQQRPQYDHVVDEVAAFFTERIELALAAGIKQSSILLDPGIGFGKRLEDNLTLIRSLDVFKTRFGMPVLLGVSRKSFLGLLTGCGVEDREIETAVAGAIGIAHGADILRVHDVEVQQRAIRVASALT